MPNRPTAAPAFAGATVEPDACPDIRDPRVMVAVPRERRPAVTALWALADDGAAGVEALLRELASDLTEALRLAGAPSVSAVPRDLAVPAQALGGPFPGV